ncbi:glycosyltransferase family 4 protein [Lactiplantibacillus plantarum]|uniref:glycosyltransferase family 4 protein n=1 Tax=Lactiplantibacillus plantarum TaxID=1590 RepID=UPI001330A2C8|nr:glycosyltransferase family 4 protein [Lactiplantibacillus plantarum]UJL23479.1 glycosyltransferase family 4 protein [Lactiplantibacillus plantarum]
MNKNGNVNQQRVSVIFLISSLKRCGPVNVLFSLISKLNLDKFTPTIFTFKSENESSRLNDFKQMGVTVIQSQGVLACIRTVKKQLKNSPYVIIVHSHGIIPDLINLLCRNSKCVSISTLHSFPFEDYPMTFGKVIGTIMAFVHIAIERRLICVACSPSIKDQLYMKSKIKVLSIANGVSFPNKWLEQYQSNRFLCLGNISERKNVAFLLKMFALPELSQYFLDVVGDGDLYSKMSEKYKENTNIRFWGRVNNPHDFLNSSGYLISASLSEGLPMAVLEALSYGLPVLLSDIPSHAMILGSGNFGLKFKLGDDQDFKEKLDHLVHQHFSRNDISNSARKLYSDTAMSKRYEKIYNEFLEQRQEDYFN